jgi:hypothetical protein
VWQGHVATDRGSEWVWPIHALIKKLVETEIGSTTHNLVVNIRKIKMHMRTGRGGQHKRKTGMGKKRSPRISSPITRTTRGEKV